MSGALPVGTLEVSFDPLSDTTPTWTDISAYLISADWSEGKANDLDEPAKGSASFVLDNSDGRFTPEFATGAYFPPGPRPLQRLRFNVDDGTTSQDQGIWYVVDWGNTFQQGTYQEVTVQAESGALILERWKLSRLDPPDAGSYGDVVAHDTPWGHWQLGDPAGTQAVAKFRRRRGKRVRVGSSYVTASDAEGTSGPAGTYKNTPTLGVPGLILGDPDTAVLFANASSEWVRIPIETDDLNGKAFTLEAIVEPVAGSVDRDILTGPVGPGAGPIFGIRQVASSNDYQVFVVVDSGPTIVTASGGAPAAATRAHIVGTWTGTLLSLYVDGVVVATAATPNTIGSIGANPAVQIGASVAGGGNPFDGVIDEAAVYEYALTAERVLAHYQAAAERGFDAELAGERVASIITSGLWAETEIQAGSHEVAPAMQTGQSRWEEVLRAVKSEMPTSLFYFDGDGNPVYLGWDYKTQARSNTVQATFGDSGSEVPYEALDVVYDEEVYNTVTVSREGGTAQTVTDADSEDEFFESAYDVTGLTHTDDMGCVSIATEILSEFKQPRNRVASVLVAGIQAAARTQILTREIGDMVEVKRRPHDTNPAVDVIAHIIGAEKHMDKESGSLSCVYSLSRGFGAADGVWKLGLDGYSELGETTVLA